MYYMTNLSDYKSQERTRKVDTIIKSIEKCWEAGKYPDKRKILAEIMYEFGATDRLAKEYLGVAIAMINAVIEENGLIMKSGNFTETERILRATAGMLDEEIHAKAEADAILENAQ